MQYIKVFILFIEEGRGAGERFVLLFSAGLSASAVKSFTMAQTVRPRVYGVTELNNYLRETLAEDSFLNSLAICGEISGFNAHSSGHIYFTLKENDCSIRVVMFRRYAATLEFLPADGDKVIVIGGVSLYEKDGSCQLYAEAVLPAGEGGAAKELERLRKRLEAEGLFAPERKKPLPRYVFDLGVITSPQGAAWADIRRIAYGRNPAVKLTLYPASVQGVNAPSELPAAMAAADLHGHDALLIARGGGAEADLAAFDTETVARAVATCVTPVISAVGHESDFSLCDLAADLRAATPTHGAAAVTDRNELLEYLDAAALEMSGLMAGHIADLRRRLAELDPANAARRGITNKAQQLSLISARLAALDPLAVFSRGYSVIFNDKGETVSDGTLLAAGDMLTIYPAKGRITAIVENTGKEGING